ncbi:MAG: sensor domain-containing diguanylate cyclase [Candidatus Edwardsbacteria bacterium]
MQSLLYLAILIFFFLFLIFLLNWRHEKGKTQQIEQEYQRRLSFEERHSAEALRSMKAKVESFDKESSEKKRLFVILLDLAKTLGGVLGREEIPPLLVQIAQQIFDGDELSFFFPDAHRTELRLVFSYGLPKELTKNLVIKMGDGYIGHTAAKKLAMTKQDFENESNIVKEKIAQTKIEGLNTFLCIPFLYRGNLLGVMNIGKAGQKEEEKNLILLLQNLGSIALENARLLEELQSTDRLTGLYNWRYFEERLNAEISRAMRFGHSLSVAFFDLDHFRAYNDLAGSEAGDAVLKDVGELLRNNVRKIDLTCRKEEDMFVVMLLETDREQAQQFGEKIRRLVETELQVSKHFPSAEKITVSGMIVNYPRDGNNAGTLCQTGTKLLAEFQKTSGNGIVVAT